MRDSESLAKVMEFQKETDFLGWGPFRVLDEAPCAAASLRGLVTAGSDSGEIWVGPTEDSAATVALLRGRLPGMVAVSILELPPETDLAQAAWHVTTILRLRGVELLDLGEM